MLYQIKNGTVSCGGQEILSHIDFEIKGREKIAVVGANGTGKTTLLKLIAGELTLDRDDKRDVPGIFQCRNLTVGMLGQTPDVDIKMTVNEYISECTDIQSDWEFDRLFTGFGFAKEEKQRQLMSFSGGEQTKIFLIRLLLEKPDILLLDEPTNHLDIDTVEWLEDYMKEYDKAVVFVSHDRFFLDQVVDVVYECRSKRLKRYAGNYSGYREQKNRELQLQRKAYERDMAEVERLNQLIEKFKHKPKKAAFARSRQTILNRMKLTEKPQEEEAYRFLTPIEPEVAGSKWVMEAEHLKIGYDKSLLELSLRVRKGQKIGIIGENGTGKSTFLKTVAGKIDALEGKLILGNHTTIGYFDQHTACITSEKSIYDFFHDRFPVMTEKDTRMLLATFMFRGKDLTKKVSELSGGEKSRLVLACLLTSRPNFLLLDEPTNHMDIMAKENLESAFQAYQGTILFVSHDRYFMNELADALLVFDKDSVKYYPFGYEHYVRKKNASEGGNVSALVDAEAQALIAGLRAVPKAERHETKPMTTEEAHLDWKLTLAAGPMRDAESAYAEAYERYAKEHQKDCEREWEEYIRKLYGGYGSKRCKQDTNQSVGGEYEAATEERGTVEEGFGEDSEKKNLLRLQENWTEKCLAWYENLLEQGE